MRKRFGRWLAAAGSAVTNPCANSMAGTIMPGERATPRVRNRIRPMLKSTRDSVHWAELFDLLEGVLAWVKDQQGRYLWVNRAFLIQYALDHPGEDGEAGRILGRTDYDLSPSFIADQFRLDDEQVLDGHRIIN